MIRFRILSLIFLTNITTTTWAAEQEKEPKPQKVVSQEILDRAAAGKAATAARKAAAKANKSTQVEDKTLPKNYLEDPDYILDVKNAKLFAQPVDFRNGDLRIIRFKENEFIDSLNALRKPIALAMFYREHHKLPSLLLGVATDKYRFEVALRTVDLYIGWANVYQDDLPITYFFLKEFYAQEPAPAVGTATSASVGTATSASVAPLQNAFDLPLDEEEEELQVQLLATLQVTRAASINVGGEPEYSTFPKPLLVEHFEKLNLFSDDADKLRRFNFHLAVLIAESIRLKPVAAIVHEKVIRQNSSFHLTEEKNFPEFAQIVKGPVKEILKSADGSRKEKNAVNIETVYHIVTNWKSTTELRLNQLTKNTSSNGIEKVLGVPQVDLYNWLHQVSSQNKLSYLKRELNFLLGAAQPDPTAKAKPVEGAKKEVNVNDVEEEDPK